MNLPFVYIKKEFVGAGINRHLYFVFRNNLFEQVYEKYETAKELMEWIKRNPEGNILDSRVFDPL